MQGRERACCWPTGVASETHGLGGAEYLCAAVSGHAGACAALLRRQQISLPPASSRAVMVQTGHKGLPLVRRSIHGSSLFECVRTRTTVRPLQVGSRRVADWKRQNSAHRPFIAYDVLQSSGHEQRDLTAHPCTFVLLILVCGPLF